MALPGTFLPFDKILCPIDFSEPSYTALKAAGEFSIYFSARLTLLHVLHPIPPVEGSAGAAAEDTVPSYRKDLEEVARSSLSEVANEEGLIRDRLTLVVLYGDPADEIVRFSSDQGNDLIVIATHGRTGWRKSVFGSVAEHVVRLARCPVLTIGDPSGW